MKLVREMYIVESARRVSAIPKKRNDKIRHSLDGDYDNRFFNLHAPAHESTRVPDPVCTATSDVATSVYPDHYRKQAMLCSTRWSRRGDGEIETLKFILL